MAWIKRNLFFLLSLVAGLALTGYCGYLFIGVDLSNNKTLNTDFQTSQNQFNQLQRKPVYPSDEHLQQAKAGLGEVTEFEDQLHKAFSPWAAFPKEDEKGFSAYLEDTIVDLKTKATNASVGLPETIAFGFTDQRGKLRYPLESIDPWMQQLTEIKALNDILLKAKINSLAYFRRVAVSSNDLFLNPNDTFPASMVVTPSQTRTPYKMEFRCFSRELAAVMDGLARSSNCFVVKNVVVMPAGLKLPEVAQTEPEPAAATPPAANRPRSVAAPVVTDDTDVVQRALAIRMARTAAARAASTAAPAPAKTGGASGTTGPATAPVTALREQLLYITLSVEAVKFN